MAQQQVFNAKLTLTDAQVKRLTEPFKELNDAAAIQAVTQETVQMRANGGIMLPPAMVTRIEKRLGKIEDPLQVVEAIEAAQHMEGDNVVVSMVMDPLWTDELKEKARLSDMELVVLLSELFSQAMHMGIFYDVDTERFPLFFTADQLLHVQKALGSTESKPVFGESLARKLGWKPAAVGFDPIEDEIFAGGKV